MGTTDVPSATKAAQVRLNRVTPSHCRVVLDNPPLNLMGPEFVRQIREIVTALENDDRVKVVVFESAVDGFCLNHSDFLAKLEDLTSIPQGPTGPEAWPDVLVRLTRAPFVSIALIRGRTTGNGSELALACDMSFASREKALLSQWEMGVGLVPGGGLMARLPRVMGRGRALEVLLSADDIPGANAELLGCVNRAIPRSGRGCAARGGTQGAVRIMRIDGRRITRSVAKLPRRRSLRRAAAGPAREATMTQQAVTVLVPERPAAGEKPAEPGAGGDEALVTGELLVEEISIDGMCGVY